MCRARFLGRKFSCFPLWRARKPHFPECGGAGEPNHPVGSCPLSRQSPRGGRVDKSGHPGFEWARPRMGSRLVLGRQMPRVPWLAALSRHHFVVHDGLQPKDGWKILTGHGLPLSFWWATRTTKTWALPQAPCRQRRRRLSAEMSPLPYTRGDGRGRCSTQPV